MIHLFGIKATYCSFQEVPPLQDTCNAMTKVMYSQILIYCFAKEKQSTFEY